MRINNRRGGPGGKVLPFEQPGEFFFRRGLDKLDSNNLVEAMANYREALSRDPDNAEIKLAMAETLTEMGRYDESNRLLLTLFSGGERPPECYFGMGCNFMATKEYGRAQDSLLQYTEAAPDGEFIFDAFDMLDALEDSGVLDEPLDTLDAAEAEAMAEEGRERLAKEDFKGAAAILKQLLSKEPDAAYVKNNLALALYCCREYKAALAQIDEVLKKDPNDIQAHCNRAIFLRTSKEEKAVQQEIDYLSEVRSEDPEELNRVAVTLMELGSFEAALPFARKVSLAEPYDPGATHRLAVCVYETGHYREAADCYDRLAKLDPTDSVARFYRGVCRAALAGRPRSGGLMLNYQVPLEEMLLRIKRLNELVNKPTEELKPAWTAGELDGLLRWAVGLSEHTVKRAILAFVAAFEDKRAELFLRDFLLQKEQPSEMKRDAFGLLKRLGAEEPYLGYLNGDLVESRVNLIKGLPEDVPEAYREVIELCFTHMAEAGRSQQLMVEAANLWGTYVLSLDGYPHLSRLRIAALAAGLEYLACRRLSEKVTKASLCRAYGVSLVRFNSAMARIAGREPVTWEEAWLHPREADAPDPGQEEERTLVPIEQPGEEKPGEKPGEKRASVTPLPLRKPRPDDGHKPEN